MAKKFSQARARYELARREWEHERLKDEPHWAELGHELKVLWFEIIDSFVARNRDLLRLL